MSGFCKDSRLARPARLVADEVDNDAKIIEFFELASSGDPPPYFASPDLFSLSSLAQYPPELRLHHVSASNCASYGYLPLISRFYAIIDNRLFLWRANRRTFSEQTTVEEKVITCVCAFKGANNFFARRVKTLLAIATPTYINVHIMEEDVIKFDTFYTVATTFVPMVMCPGNPNELLIGGSDGGVHLFHFLPPVEGGLWRFGAAQQEQTFELKTNSQWLSLGASSPVKGLWFDASTGLVAALSSAQDAQSLRFWKLVDGSMSSAGMTYHVPKGIKFVSLSPVPICESEYIRFVAFASDGTRYYFGTTSWFWGLWTRVNLRGTRERPVELNDETVVSGFYSLGFYVFVTKGNLCVIRSKCVDGGYELVGGTSLPGTGLDVIGFDNHSLTFLATNMYHEPGVWQHFETPPKAIVMTSEGTCQLVLEPPVAELRRLLVESSGAYSEPVKGFMEINEGSGAAAILLADMWPELRGKAIHVAYKFMREKMTDTGDEPNPETLTFVTQSFYLRVARILALGWQRPVFERDQDQQLRISAVFRKAQTRMLDQLQNIKGVIDEYKSFSATNRPYGDREEVIMDIENRQLNQLNSFVDFCIEILKLVTILSRQKALLAKDFVKDLDEHVLERLETSNFFDSNAKVPLDEALRNFVMQLYIAARDDPCLDFLAAQIGKECPNFSQIADAQIAEAMDNVDLATRMDEDYRGDLLRDSVSVLLEFIDRRKINIRKICAMLFEVEEYARAIDLVCARVAAIDDVEQGFYWWHNGCDESDETGKEAFLKDYDCYEAVFQAVHTPEGLKAIEEKDNQFLHIVIFDKLLKSNDLTLLFSINSKYLEPYIKDSSDWNVRELLYKLYIGKREYEKATLELLKIASDAEGFSLAQRIEWLETARTTGTQAHRKDLVDEAKVRLNCAKIQKKMSIDSDCILGLQELLAEAKKEKRWSICLEILNLQPPTKDREMSIEITNMWLNFLTDSGHGDDYVETEEEINARVGRFLHALPPSSEILSPEYLLPAFEDTRYRLGLKPTWAVSFLTTICVSGTRLFGAYCDFILDFLPADIARDRRNQLVYAAVWLLRTYRGDFSRLADIVKEIVNDQDSPYRREILAVVDSLVNDSQHGAGDSGATISE